MFSKVAGYTNSNKLRYVPQIRNYVQLFLRSKQNSSKLLLESLFTKGVLIYWEKILARVIIFQ